MTKIPSQEPTQTLTIDITNNQIKGIDIKSWPLNECLIGTKFTISYSDAIKILSDKKAKDMFIDALLQRISDILIEKKKLPKCIYLNPASTQPEKKEIV